MQLFRKFKRLVYPVTSRYLIWTILAEGVLKGTDRPFRCLFIDNSPFAEYLLGKMYEGHARILRKRKALFSGLRRNVRSLPEGTDLCIAALPSGYESEFSRLCTFKGRSYVRQIIDTSGTREEIEGRFSRNKKKISRKLENEYGFSYRISRDIKDFDFFYYRMHHPHISKQFGDQADIDPYETLRDFFLGGFLFLVIRSGQTVAGSLCMVRDRVLTAHRAGLLDGERDHVRSGAQMAVYYFRTIFANEQGFSEIDTMNSRPFLNDGVYQTKREWGAMVYPEHGAEHWVYFFIPAYSESVVRFFEANPAIVLTEDGLMGVVGAQGAPEISDEIRKDLTKRFYAPGLDGLLLLFPHADKPAKLLFNTEEGS